MHDRLLAALSHHLRVPLNAIAGGLPQLRSGSEQAREAALAVLERSVTTEAALIANLSTAVELFGREPDRSFEPVDLGMVISDAVAMLGGAARARRVVLQWRPASGPMLVMADSPFLTRAIARVCRSALAATPVGGRLRVVVERTSRGKRLCVCVWPITPLRRAPAGRSTKRPSTTSIAAGRSDERDLCGTLAREILAAHGGSVSVRRAHRGRQALQIVLPAANLSRTAGTRPPPPPHPKAPRPRPTRTAPRLPAARSRLPKVLLVDDYVDALEMWAFFLRSSGYDVFTARSGPQAIQQAERYRPDVILLDLGLPGMSGYDTARVLRASPTTASTPMIAVTGYSGSREHKEAMAAGLDAVMVKPVQPAALLQRIERLLQKLAPTLLPANEEARP